MLQFHEIFEIFREIATLDFKFHEIFVKIIIRVAISRSFFFLQKFKMASSCSILVSKNRILEIRLLYKEKNQVFVKVLAAVRFII